MLPLPVPQSPDEPMEVQLSEEGETNQQEDRDGEEEEQPEERETTEGGEEKSDSVEE